jgi:hypothetical protein
VMTASNDDDDDKNNNNNNNNNNDKKHNKKSNHSNILCCTCVGTRARLAGRRPDSLGPIFSQRVYDDYVHIFGRVCLSSILLVCRPPPFFTMGWALRVLDANTRRATRQTNNNRQRSGDCPRQDSLPRVRCAAPGQAGSFWGAT